MNTFQTHEPEAFKVAFTESEMVVYLKDGRVLSVPLVWFPTLEHASQEALEDYELLGDGEGIHWPQLDEDLSVQGLLLGIGHEEKIA
ncbi:DUF2442 domain-containing protein [Hydrogenimonas sp.]